ncbi:Zn2+-binding dehydrogenase [Klebsormidium nitens]|uniref:Zn2+-binding dehydrogenase n=1 Tax=Klebsormidium nitens TaxID=105231 RepID=A0A1Y1HPY1_KLENI|nr:Zn2+-binding dehydrogenase [Klebsormidium nitens]|eukprot:GAQ80133.1 Zn2+-binding dehydrogenase [Klebsormidium nitens]
MSYQAPSAIYIRKQDGQAFLDEIEVGRKEKPSPQAGEVLVRLLVRPVNPADVLSMQGYYPGFQPASLPAIPGLEGYGKIEEIGSGVSGLSVGQRVVPILLNNYTKHGNGSWQDYIAVKQDDIIPIPDSISDEHAAQFIVNPWTAIGLLKFLNIPKGEWLLQTGASSVLGRQIIALAKHLGIKTVNVVRRPDAEAELKALGADAVIASTGDHSDLSAKVKQVTGANGAYAAIDAVAGDIVKALSESVRNNGLLVLYGGMSGAMESVFMHWEVALRKVNITGYWVTPDIAAMTPEQKRERANEVIDLMNQRVISPFSGEKFDLKDVKKAVQKSLEEKRGGKVLLVG